MTYFSVAQFSRRPGVRPLAIVTLFILSVGLYIAGSSVTQAELDGPDARDRQVAIAVTSFLNKDHLSRRALDDQVSERCIDSFFQALDPRKLYFLQSDLEHFHQWETSLDDLIKQGDVTFAHNVYKVFLERLEKRAAAITELIEMEHDFTVDESLIVEFDAREYPKDADEARDRWRKQIKYDLLVQKANKVEDSEAREKLARRYRTYAQNKRQMDGEELLEIYLTALTTAYDPHTSYMSPSTLENFQIAMRLQLDGIGAALQMIDGHTVISKIIPGGAADKDGRLQPEDHIIGVGQGTAGEIVDAVGMRLNDVVKKIRGKRGTIVRLQVTAQGKGEPKIYDITRAKIELKDSEARAEIIEDGHKANGNAYKVGVIDLPSFYMDMDAARLGKPDYKSTTRDVRNLLRDFRAQNVDAVVLDLRRNGGGSLTEAISLTGLFIDRGPIVQVKDADGNIQHYDDRDAGAAWNGPLVVLVSKFSASASEIFAGAIKDYHRGLVVGDHATHGKGTVQTLLDVGRQLFRFPPNAPAMGALKITMQQFYLPNGDSTQNRGVLADIELPSITTHLDVGESDLDYAMAFDQVEAVPFKQLQQVNPVLVGQVRQRSEQRRQTSEDFQKVLKRIARYKKQKERTTISLNEEVFMADRADLDEEEDAIKDVLDEDNDPEDAVVKRDFYFNEALAITIDYIQLLQNGQVAGN